MSQKMGSSLSDLLGLHCTPFGFEALVSNTAQPQFQQNPSECCCGMEETVSSSAVPFLIRSGFPYPIGPCVINMCKNLFPTTSTQLRAEVFKHSILHFKLLQFIK